MKKGYGSVKEIRCEHDGPEFSWIFYDIDGNTVRIVLCVFCLNSLLGCLAKYKLGTFRGSKMCMLCEHYEADAIDKDHCKLYVCDYFVDKK